jgi:hypothetical protein
MKSKKEFFQEITSIAKKHGGTVLSKKYTHATYKMKFKCASGHIWETTPAVIKRGSWCAPCAGILPSEEQYKKCQETAKKFGGKVLSKFYHYQGKMQFLCKNHGKFRANGSDIRIGIWCKKCKGSRISHEKMPTLAEMRQKARELNWEFLSPSYSGQKEIYNWKCPHGHVVNTYWNAVQRHPNECSTCKKVRNADSLKNKWKKRLQDMQELAFSRNGKCTAKEFLGELVPISFECECGSQWIAAPTSIDRGSWCARCSSGLGERMARTGMQQLFGKQFPPASPKWLINPKTNRPLRYDGFNKELKIAFEHQGRQHDELSPGLFHRKKNIFENQKYLDSLKVSLSKKHRVKLIFIPEMPARLKQTDFKDYIENELKRLKIKLPTDFEKIELLWNEAYSSKDLNAMEYIRNYAKQKGGECLSPQYFGGSHKYKFICAENHTFEMAGTKIKQGRWCRKCASIQNGLKKRIGIEWFHMRAKEMKGICKTKTYENRNTRLTLNCLKGHPNWKTSAASILAGSWCPKCGNIVTQIKKRSNKLKK